MEQQILEILNNLKADKLTICTAKSMLFHLFEKGINISYPVPQIGDIVSNGLYEAKIVSQPQLKADIIWQHNKAHDQDASLSQFNSVIKLPKRKRTK